MSVIFTTLSPQPPVPHAPSPTDIGAYVTEDKTIVYVTEDGKTTYIKEKNP